MFLTSCLALQAIDVTELLIMNDIPIVFHEKACSSDPTLVMYNASKSFLTLNASLAIVDENILVAPVTKICAQLVDPKV